MDAAPRPSAFFVGEHPALDFLNTKATPSGVTTDWLADGADLLAWLEQAGAIPPEVASRYRKGRNARTALDEVARQARTLRDWFRTFVMRHAGRPLGADAVAELGPLNLLLANEDCYRQIEAGRPDSPPLVLRTARRWTTPEQLLQPVAESLADLACRADFRLIRACEGSACTLLFLDRTKSHARRWCSMAACGNRAKAAAHRARASSKSPRE